MRFIYHLPVTAAHDTTVSCIVGVPIGPYARPSCMLCHSDDA